MSLEQGKVYNICGARGTGKSSLAARLIDLFFPEHIIITNDKSVLDKTTSTRKDNELVKSLYQLKFPIQNYTKEKYVIVWNGFDSQPIHLTQIFMTTYMIASVPVMNGIIFPNWKKNKYLATTYYHDVAKPYEKNQEDFDLMFHLNQYALVSGTRLFEHFLSLPSTSSGQSDEPDVVVIDIKMDNNNKQDSKMIDTKVDHHVSTNVQKSTTCDFKHTTPLVDNDAVRWEKNKAYAIMGSAETGKTWLAKYYLDKFFPNCHIVTNDQDLERLHDTAGSKRCYSLTLWENHNCSMVDCIYVIDVEKNPFQDVNKFQNKSVIFLSENYYNFMENLEILVTSKNTNLNKIPPCCQMFCKNLKQDRDVLLVRNGMSWNIAFCQVRNTYLNTVKDNTDDKKHKKNTQTNVLDTNAVITKGLSTFDDNEQKTFNVMCWSLKPCRWYRMNQDTNTKICLTSPEYGITGTLVKVVPNILSPAGGFLMSQPITDLNELKCLPVAPENSLVVPKKDSYFQWKGSVFVYGSNYKTSHLNGTTPCDYEIIDVCDGKLSFNKQYQIVQYYNRKNSKGDTIIFVLVKKV